jgi:nitrate reductase delta subunit
VNRLARAAAARRATTREHALVHRVAALLLEYPSDDLVALLPQVRGALREVRATLADPLLEVVTHLGETPLPVLEAEYVATFDLDRRRSLYLTYFAHGDTRKRGAALVEFMQAYRAAGWELVADELPDHLAVVLEFAATGDDDARAAGIGLLLAHRAGFELLRLALLKAGSPWAGILVAVAGTLPPLQGPEHEAVARLAAEGPPGEDVGLEPYGPRPLIPARGAHS